MLFMRGSLLSRNQFYMKPRGHEAAGLFRLKNGLHTSKTITDRIRPRPPAFACDEVAQERGGCRSLSDFPSRFMGVAARRFTIPSSVTLRSIPV
jgi:hypothetical protein